MRTHNLFAVASVILLILGLLFSVKYQSFSLTLTGPKSTYAIGYNVPCYGLAGLFALYACSYAAGWIALSKFASDWHLCLSISGVALFGLTFAFFGHISAQNLSTPSQLTLWTIVIGFLAGLMTFLIGQIIFAVAIARAWTSRPI